MFCDVRTSVSWCCGVDSTAATGLASWDELSCKAVSKADGVEESVEVPCLSFSGSLAGSATGSAELSEIWEEVNNLDPDAVVMEEDGASRRCFATFFNEFNILPQCEETERKPLRVFSSTQSDLRSNPFDHRYESSPTLSRSTPS